MTDQAPPKPRATFIETTSSLADKFLADLMLAVPELAGVMLVPVWAVDSPQAPIVITRVPDSQPHNMSDLLRMQQSLAAATQALHPKLLQMLLRFDQEAARLAAEIRDRQAELAALSPRPGEAAAQPADSAGHSG